MRLLAWRGRASQHQGELPLGRQGMKVQTCCFHGGAHLLFMAFGQFPCHLQRPLRAAEFLELIQELQQAMRRFVENAGARLLADLLQPLPSFPPLGGQETLKAEPGAGQAAAYKGGCCRAGARDANHVMPGGAGAGDQLLARVADAR